MHSAIAGNVPSFLRPLDRAAVLGGSLTQRQCWGKYGNSLVLRFGSTDVSGDVTTEAESSFDAAGTTTGRNFVVCGCEDGSCAPKV